MDFESKTARIPADWNRQALRMNPLRIERQATVSHNRHLPVLLGSGPTGFVPIAVAQSQGHLRAEQDRQLPVRVPTNASLIQPQRFPVLSKKQSRGEIQVAAKCGANVPISLRRTVRSKPQARPRLKLAGYSPSREINCRAEQCQL